VAHLLEMTLQYVITGTSLIAQFAPVTGTDAQIVQIREDMCPVSQWHIAKQI